MTQQTYTPDWSKAPPQANWWARDKDGSGFWYSNRPIANRRSFFINGGFVLADNDCPFINCSFELDDWQSTLTERPHQNRDIPQNLSDYFTGKTSFINAYVDLLLARMAKEGRFYCEDDNQPKSPKADDVVIYRGDADNELIFAVVDKVLNSTVWFCKQLRPKGDTYVLRTAGNIIDSDYFAVRTITELEAVEFRKAMEAVYGS